jgi:hydrogenase maturation protease
VDEPLTTKTLVLGLGNTLLSDEGAGVHAVRALSERYPELQNVELLDGGTLSFTLAGPIESADHLVVIDAANLHAAPGTVRVFVDDEMDRYLGAHNKRSVHEVSLIDLLVIARLTERLPRRRALIGIQPASLDWGDHPTREVADALPQVCDMTVDLIREWRQ